MERGTPDFGRWVGYAETASLSVLQDRIATGSSRHGFPPSPTIPLIGSADGPLRVLDFGCGLGRNLRAMSPNWQITGYDSPAMLARAVDWLGPLGHVSFCSDWDQIRCQRFDAVLVCLVFQHMTLGDLLRTLADLCGMTPRLVIESRDWMDWRRYPVARLLELFFQPAGEPVRSARDHFTGIYVPLPLNTRLMSRG